MKVGNGSKGKVVESKLDYRTFFKCRIKGRIDMHLRAKTSHSILVLISDIVLDLS